MNKIKVGNTVKAIKGSQIGNTGIVEKVLSGAGMENEYQVSFDVKPYHMILTESSLQKVQEDDYITEAQELKAAFHKHLKESMVSTETHEYFTEEIDILDEVIMEGIQEVFKAYSEDINTPLVFEFVEVKVPIGNKVMPFMLSVTGEQKNWDDDRLLELFYENGKRKLYAALNSLSKLVPSIKFTTDDLNKLETMRIQGGFTDINIFGSIQAPINGIKIKLEDFSKHAVERWEKREIGPIEAQMFIDKALFIMNQSGDGKYKYVFVSAIGSSVISMMENIESKPNSVEKVVTNWEIPYQAETEREKIIKKRLESFVRAVVDWIEKNKGIQLTVKG